MFSLDSYLLLHLSNGFNKQSIKKKTIIELLPGTTMVVPNLEYLRVTCFKQCQYTILGKNDFELARFFSFLFLIMNIAMAIFSSYDSNLKF